MDAIHKIELFCGYGTLKFDNGEYDGKRNYKLKREPTTIEFG